MRRGPRQAETARVGGGVTWQTVLDAATPHGLAPMCGSAPAVGVVGYLTGGGIGPLVRTVGLSADHVRAFELVTGWGQVLRVTPDEHADLFWGLRGGNSMFGIVTAV
jgi:FAD/FMN-containing dehydrogenase